MKKLRMILAILLLLSVMAGCTLRKDSESNVTFYYSRSDYAFGTEDSVIASESRDIAGHEGELQYILSLYLMGPLEEELTAVFPTSIRLVSTTRGDSHLTVELTPMDGALSDAEFSLACSCLSMTCMKLTGCTHVTVISGEQTLTLRMSNLLLVDTPVPTETQLEETQ